MLCLIPVASVAGWSVWRMVRGLRAGDWRRPGWFGHAAWTCFLGAASAWLSGFFAGGLEWQKTCRYIRHQPYEDGYYQTHRADYFRLFPLSTRCNAHYDLVPGWVNPTVVVFFILFVVSAAGLLWTAALRSKQKGPDGRWCLPDGLDRS
jgi:hypothetical protein